MDGVVLSSDIKKNFICRATRKLVCPSLSNLADAPNFPFITYYNNGPVLSEEISLTSHIYSGWIYFCLVQNV